MTRIEALLGFLGEAALGRRAFGHAAAGVVIHRVLPPSGLKKERAS
jgi:hypothetical protein